MILVPPRLAPIPPVSINLDENTPPQRAVFTCRVLRGSSESLSLEWLLTDGTPVQVDANFFSGDSHRISFLSSLSMVSPSM